MAYSVPTTVATDDVLTAAIWNASVANNVTYLASPPMASAYNNTTPQSIATFGTTQWTSVTLPEGEDYDTSAFHSTSSNTSRFTVPSGLGGRYRYNGIVEFAANVTGTRQLRMTVNGSEIHKGPKASAFASTTEVVRLVITGVVTLTDGQYLEIQASQNSGGNLDLSHARVQVELVSV